MNKFLLVAKNQKTYFIQRLIEEVGEDSLEFFNPWEDHLPTQSYDQVIFRSSGVYHSERDLIAAQKLRGNLINPLSALKLFRRKSTQYEFFKKHHIPSLPFFNLSSNPVKGAKAWAQEHGLKKILVKPDLGQGGWGIKAIDHSDFDEWLEQQVSSQDLAWVLQPYMENCSEYRVFFIRDKLFTLKRNPILGEVAANFTQQGSAEWVSLPASIEEHARELIQESKAFYGAMDVLETPMGAMILELNTVPGIEQLEKTTHINIMRLFLNELPAP